MSVSDIAAGIADFANNILKLAREKVEIIIQLADLTLILTIPARVIVDFNVD